MSSECEFSEMELPTEKEVSHVLVVGVGSPFGDDRFGWHVADLLRSRLGQFTPAADIGPVEIRKAAAPHQLLDWLDDQQGLVLCDACRGSGEPGTVTRFEWPSTHVRGLRFSGTHEMPLPALLELAQRLGRLPRRVTIWGAEAQAATDGEQVPDRPLAAPTERAATRVAARIREELRAFAATSNMNS